MRVGLQVGSFNVEHRLGQGASAEVWRARHASGALVALKFGSASGATGPVVDREAERLANLDHPGIVHIFDRGVVEGRSWIALELAQGTLSEHPASLGLRDLATHLLGALAHLHARGLLHFDIKPSNILVGCPPRTALTEADRAGVRLADFGISWSGGDDPNRSGSPGWCCPEQGRGLPEAHAPHADIYSLARVVEAVVDGQPTPAWAAWLARALHEDPAQRFPSAAHARASLPDAVPGAPSRRGSAVVDTVTRPVSVPVARAAPTVLPADVREPTWPERPPAQPDRLARITFLDGGSSLLPHRPVPLGGRAALLQALWQEAGTARRLLLHGEDDDVGEITQILTQWAAEVGLPITVERDATGHHVEPLTPIQLASRARALGFEPIHAVRVVRGCKSWPEVRSRLLEYVRAHVVVSSAQGLAVLGGPIQDADDRPLDEWILDRCWTGDNALLADALVALDRDRTLELRPRELLVELCQARIRTPTDAESGHRLLAASAEAWSLGRPGLAEALALSACEVLARAWSLQEALQRLDGFVPFVSPVTRARRDVVRGYLLTFLRHPEAERALHQAIEGHDGRFASTAWTGLAELREARGEPEASLEAARRAVETADPASPFEIVSAYLALARAQLFVDAPEADVEATFGVIEEQQVSSFFLEARVLLTRAGFEKHRGRFEAAEWLFTEMQGLYTRHGQPETVTIIDRSLLCLERGDLSSIPYLVPADWEEQRAAAPPFLAAMMRVHDLFVALGNGESETIEEALAVLEAEDIPRPGSFDGAFEQAAALGPPEFAARIRDLVSSPTTTTPPQ